MKIIVESVTVVKFGLDNRGEGSGFLESCKDR